MSADAGKTNTKLPHLLVVEDDAEIIDLIRRYFSKQGFEVSAVSDGAAMRDVIQEHDIDVVLLDLGLPGEDGFTLTRFLREHWKGALIIVTGRGDSVDRVVGLELGADDYVTKPFDLRELLARVRSVLRRSAETRTEETGSAAKVLRFGGFRLDLDSRSLVDPTGNPVPLTTGEFELLAVFIAHPNRVLSRDDLMNRMHGREAGPFDRSIYVHISKLRRKLGLASDGESLIGTVHRGGYIFRIVEG